MLNESNSARFESNEGKNGSRRGGESVRSGLDVLIRLRDWEWDSLRAADRATWERWASCQVMDLWRALALHAILDPDSIDPSSDKATNVIDAYLVEGSSDDAQKPFDRYLQTLAIACEAVRTGGLKIVASAQDPRRAQVDVSDVQAWATRINLPVIDDWPTADAWTELRSGGTQEQKWPWGNHTTLQLEMLRSAGDFWVSEWDRREDVPRAEDVDKHLRPLFPDSTGRQRLKVASLLRPEDVKPGPRKTPKMRD